MFLEDEDIVHGIWKQGRFMASLGVSGNVQVSNIAAGSNYPVQSKALKRGKMVFARYS